jgi:hypothetical protein
MTETKMILAIDVGIRCGFARLSPGLDLQWYQSRDLGNRARLRAAARAILREQPTVCDVILEGGGDLAEIWQKEARKLGWRVRVVSAEDWRRDLLLEREQRDSRTAKEAAVKLAVAAISEYGKPGRMPSRPDAAEAVMVALWAARERGWVTDDDIRRLRK